DFVALARSFGAYAERVEATEYFAAAFERAMASGLPALLTFRQQIEEVVPIANKADAREAETLA
uniref:thiamine pyrophosphate-dependent enzyme n=1 Tax=Niveispirillum sp. TaxID=1917217 RepID=UPI001B527ED8|nr:thiamine pyrophosphate-binding protein [Niveispirillum sp.]